MRVLLLAALFLGQVYAQESGLSMLQPEKEAGSGARDLWTTAIQHLRDDYYEVDGGGNLIQFREDQITVRVAELLARSARERGMAIELPGDLKSLTSIQIKSRFFEFIESLRQLDGGRQSETALVEKGLQLFCDNDLQYSQFWSKPYQRKRLELEDNPTLNARLDFSVRMEDRDTILCFPFKDGEAWTRGMRAGDKLVNFDGVPVARMSMQDLFLRFIGQADTKVKVSVRQKSGRVLSMTLTRKFVKREVTTRPYRGGEIYVVPDISGNTATELRALIEKADTDSVVIDLRGNGGGPLRAVPDMIGMFVDGARPLTVGETLVKGKLASKLETSVRPIEGIKRINLIVDSGTASTAELFVAVLMETMGDKVVVAGEKTYGKDVWAELVPFAGGGALILPMGPIRTPGGKGWTNGIEPTFGGG